MVDAPLHYAVTGVSSVVKVLHGFEVETPTRGQTRTRDPEFEVRGAG